MSFLNKVLQFLKNNWQIVVALIAASIIIWHIRSFFLKRESDLYDHLQEMQKIHNEELDKVKKAFEDERDRHEKNVKKLEDDLKEAEAKYKIAIEELEKRKKVNVNFVVKKYGNDPGGLAEKVKSVTGFEIIQPVRR